jgi:hypothetical protein
MQFSRGNLSHSKHRSIRFHRQKMGRQVLHWLCAQANSRTDPRPRPQMYETLREAFDAARRK